jgi:hypothetical protein
VPVFGLQQSPVSQKVSAVQPVGVSEMPLGAIMGLRLQIKTSSVSDSYCVETRC